jgi:hypothetical protein
MIDLKTDGRLDDETPVELNADQLQVAEKEVQEIWTALTFLADNLKDLTVSTRHSSMGCIESFFARLSQAVGYDGDIKKAKDGRNTEIREKNIEIRRLENLVGQNRGVDGVAESLSLCSQNFNKYWKKIGFTLVYDHPSEEKCGGFGAGWGRIYYRAHLASMLNTHIDSHTDTPVSDAEEKGIFIEDMKKLLDLGTEDRYHHLVFDTKKSRNHIESKLKERFPSLTVTDWHIQELRGHMTIRSLNIKIENIEEMLPTDEEMEAIDSPK